MLPARLSIIVSIALLACPISACSAQPGAARGSEQSFKLTGWGGPAMKVATYRPANWQPDSPVVIALHGINRNMDYTFETWQPLADRHGFLLIVPHFDRWRFAGSHGYALGDVGRKGEPRDSSYRAIEPIFDEVRRNSGSTRSGYRLFGHSAGAQFVHRFLWLHPEARVERAVISMAGWYALPDRTIAWPYGVKGVPQANLAAAFADKVMIQIGENDDDPQADDLRRTRETRRQGRTRFDRGQYFYHQARDTAAGAGLPFNWELSVAERTGHDSRGAAEDAVDWLAR